MRTDGLSTERLKLYADIYNLYVELALPSRNDNVLVHIRSCLEQLNTEVYLMENKKND